MTKWALSQRPVDYPEAVAAQERHVAAMLAGEADELVWLLEHPALYTRGASAKASDLIEPDRFPVFETGRGGQFTYHGPGQRVAYVMLDLSKRGRDVKQFVCSLEQWLIDALAEFNLKGERRKSRIGVWIDRAEPGEARLGFIREDKIAAIGVRLKRWVSFHGVSLNVAPDLSHFGGITPCGVSDPNLGVTSLAALGRPIAMHEVDVALERAFEKNFGAVERGEAPL